MESSGIREGQKALWRAGKQRREEQPSYFTFSLGQPSYSESLNSCGAIRRMLGDLAKQDTLSWHVPHLPGGMVLNSASGETLNSQSIYAGKRKASQQIL